MPLYGSGSTTPTGAAGGDLTGTYPNPTIGDLKVLARSLSDLARNQGGLPTGAFASTLGPGPMRQAASNLTVAASGTLHLMNLVLPGGRAVSSISAISNSSSTTLTHSWACLVDKTSLALLATTVDDTTTWPGTVTRTWQIATSLGGGTGGGTYTPSSGTEIYVGICQVAGTPSTLGGFNGNSVRNGMAPISSGTSNTGLTDPASLVSALSSGAVAALTGHAIVPWVWVA